MSGRNDREEAPTPSARPAAGPRRLKVSELMAGELMAGEREAILEHGGQEYRLRITASGKLILTK